ncbi:MAG: PAS domain-containing protein [Bdellovibrionales bacterium]|nr:PAS domain-containing protein [Bdellovibrionales bacterium]
MTTEQLRGIIDAPFNEPDYTQKYVRDDAQVVASGEPLHVPEEPVVCHTGETRLFNTVKTPLFDDEGKVALTVGVSRDITAQVAARKALEEQQARSMYAAKMATLGEMAGGVAHEVNNPISIIYMLANEIRDTLESGTDDREFILRSAQKIERTALRISKIVSGLKMFPRESSRDPLEKVGIHRLLEETLDLCRERFIQNNIELKVNAPQSEVCFDCRPTQLSQVLLNLLGNASDAIEHQSDKWVRLDVTTAGNNIVISVTDSGSGIPKAMQEDIFRPFYTTKEIGKGTGLGLSVSKGLIESNRGTLHLDTSSSNTRFVITLPLETTP